MVNRVNSYGRGNSKKNEGTLLGRILLLYKINIEMGVSALVQFKKVN